MSSGPLGVPGAKPALLLSTLLSLFGIAGVIGSYAVLTFTPGAEPEGLLADDASRALTELMVRSSLLQALAAANLVVSSLLVVSSFVLMLRRPSAAWWIRQALLGNVLYTVAAMGGAIGFHHQHADAIQQIADQLPQLQEAAPGTPMPAAWAVLAGRDVCVGLVVLGVYFLIWRLARRPDVRQFVRAEPSRGE